MLTARAEAAKGGERRYCWLVAGPTLTARDSRESSSCGADPALGLRALGGLPSWSSRSLRTISYSVRELFRLGMLKSHALIEGSGTEYGGLLGRGLCKDCEEVDAIDEGMAEDRMWAHAQEYKHGVTRHTKTGKASRKLLKASIMAGDKSLAATVHGLSPCRRARGRMLECIVFLHHQRGKVRSRKKLTSRGINERSNEQSHLSRRRSLLQALNRCLPLFCHGTSR